jgi:ABC-type lipoprotein release transport system permease subunit
VSIFVDSSHLALLVAMAGIATISGLVTAWSIQEQDAKAAWLWVTVFGTTSFIPIAWSFWRLV